MSMAQLGYFAGGLTQGYGQGREIQNRKKLVDIDEQRLGLDQQRIGLAKNADARAETSFNAERTAWQNVYAQLKDKYPELAQSIQFSNLGKPQQPAAPAGPNAIPGLTRPVGPLGGLNAVPFDPNRPVFTAY